VNLTVEFEFAASHQLHHVLAGPHLHGHNYLLYVEVGGPVDPATGFVADFDLIEQVVRREVIDRIDHRHLNDFLEQPTAEVMLAWFWRRLAPHLPLVSLRLHETRRYYATYHGEPGILVRFAPGYTEG
jgi:6-pyruvoyltetrahydropterin/6-carboxytetrahydropterin synthase